jgi:diguanylate cyclase (GGDEF)-like protein
MQKERLANLSAAFLILFASCVMTGWVFHIPFLIQIQSGMVGMVMNTAVNFFLLGITLLLFRINNTHTRIIQRILLSIVLILSVASLSQDISNHGIGIDNLFIRPWLIDPNPTPGRMAPNSSIGFIVCSLIGILIPFGQKRFIATIIHFFTIVIFLMAIVGVLVYSLKLEFILTWYSYTRMAIPTAICFFVMSIGWWSVWNQTQWENKFYEGREDRKIVFITGIILVTLILIAGLGSLAGLAYLDSSKVNNILQDNLKKKISQFSDSITNAQLTARAIITNPILLEDINKKNLTQINVLMESLLTQRFTAIQIKNLQGEILFRKGTFIQAMRFSAPLHVNYGQANLFWNNGFEIKIDMPIFAKDQYTVIGYFSGEKILPDLDKIYQDYSSLGTTGEIILCSSPKPNDAECFPTRKRFSPYHTAFVQNGNSLPISYALAGQVGSLTTFDYAGKSVFAAYSPLNALGLGMVAKIETKEIYQPLHNEIILNCMIAFILGTIGLFVIRWQITPLVRKVVSSEKKANQANKKLELTVAKLNQRNKEISLLRDLSEALQACLNMQESFPIIAEYGKKILPETSAILFIIHTSHNYFESALNWGSSQIVKKIIKSDDCWALCKNSIYKVHDAKESVICNHVDNTADKPFSYICIPLIAQSEIIGLLYIEKKVNYKINLTRNFLNYEFVASALSEQIALGLSNIRLRETLKAQSIRDSLSGLFNRRYLEDEFSREISRAQKNTIPISVLMIDIDHFKNFNDEWGHDAGDVVIQAFGRVLQNAIHAGGIACRYGGEEFIILLPGIIIEEAYKRAESLHEMTNQLTLNYGNCLLKKITISIGIAAYPQHGKTAQEIITAADKALYQAKSSGRNNTIIQK